MSIIPRESDVLFPFWEERCGVIGRPIESISIIAASYGTGDDALREAFERFGAITP